MARGDEAVAEGLAKVAHAIRRSAALNVAMQMTPADGTLEDMLDLFHQLADVVGGDAVRAETQRQAEGGPGAPGVPWSERDLA